MRTRTLVFSLPCAADAHCRSSPACAHSCLFYLCLDVNRGVPRYQTTKHLLTAWSRKRTLTNLIVKLAATAPTDLIQVLVAFDRTPLNRFTRAHSRTTTSTIAPAPRPSPRWRPTRTAILRPARVAGTVVGTGTVVVTPSARVAKAAATDGTGTALVTASCRIPADWTWHGAGRKHLREGRNVGETQGEHVVHSEVLQVEATRRSGRRLTVRGRKVAIAIGVSSRWGYVSRVNDVGVDQFELQLLATA